MPASGAARTVRWRWRLVIPVAVLAIYAGIVLATGRELNAGVLVAGAVVACVLLWLALDVGSVVPYTSWQVSAPYTPRQPGRDMRLDRLTDRLTSGVDREAVAYEVHRALAEVVEERLRRNHGIDRADDRAAADQVLGPELTAYLDAPPRLRRTGQAQDLSALLDRIEDL